MKQIREKSQTDMMSLLSSLDESVVRKILSRKNVTEYILENSENKDLIRFISDRKEEE